MAVVGISLGSNLGDRLALLVAARERLASVAELGSLRVSSLFETDPVDCDPGDPAFLNAVLEIRTDKPPLELLRFCQEIETDLGRPLERERNSPRPADLDLLYYDDLEMNTPELTLPHPRMRSRRFVLLPLHELRPDLVSDRETRHGTEGVKRWRSDW